MIQALQGNIASGDASAILADGVERLRRFKRQQVVLSDWFLVQKIHMDAREAAIRDGLDPHGAAAQARILCAIAREMPLSLPEGSVLAGSQDGAFSPSYALIHPDFKVEDFKGYCDPTAVYNDIAPQPDKGIDAALIARVRQYWSGTPYVHKLQSAYAAYETDTSEVVFFMEPVTGHTIPDLRPFLKHGIRAMQDKARALGTDYGHAMADALEAPCILATRYQALAREMLAHADADAAIRLTRMIDALERVPAQGAATFQEALQSFALLWQCMVLEQAPNPYAFSAGNIDRVFAPYLDTGTSRAEAVELLRHLLCFFQVGSRCWAISQNILLGGRDADGRDATNPVTECLLDAFFLSNDPQPALSVRLHRGTPEGLYENLGRFFFTPGHSTPSLLNDESVIPMLTAQGILPEHAAEYAIAGCQEPLVMGRGSMNTTNTWLNLAKVLELACNDGQSLITGKQLGPTWKELGFANEADAWQRLSDAFDRMLGFFLARMEKAGNACTRILGEHKPVPFTSACMEGLVSGADMRDPERPGVRYHGSGCLIHGLSVVADSLFAVGRALATGAFDASAMRAALRRDFSHTADAPLRDFLSRQDKFGNHLAEIDALAARLAGEVSDRVHALRNTAGNAYLPDWSTPSTHLLYGYWVGATPDGRRARTMLGYGVDPRPEATRCELPDRIASQWSLPFGRMRGGYASHYGLRPTVVAEGSFEDRGRRLAERLLKPLFRFDGTPEVAAPYYLYLNVDTVDHLRAVLREPEKHAPDGIYIMRIHGTFVNFLDLSPAIQQDILERLDTSRGAHPQENA